MIFQAKRARSACFIVLAALMAVALLPTAHAQISMRGFYGDLSDTHDTFLSLDLNGDGKADMLYSRPGSGTAGAYLSHGDGTFHYVSYANGSGSGQSGFTGDLRDTRDTFVALDLNGDGKSDFIEYRPGGGDTIRCLSNGDGTVRCDSLSIGGTDYFNFGDSMTNSNTRIVAMNRRGSPSEFLVYTPGGGSAAIYIPQVGSSNLQSINLTANSTPSRATGWQETMTAGDEHIVPLDINGDGSPDLLVFSPRAGTVHLYRNNGSNGFALFTLAVPGRNSNGFTGNSQDNNARAIALDLNGDGKQDFLWWQAGTKTVIGFLSNGDGTVKAVNYLTGGTPGNGFQDTDSSMGDNAVALDLNGDGKSDFLWYSPGNSIVTAYTSSSTGALTAASYRTGTGTSQNFQSSSSTQYDTALPLNFLGQAASGFVWYVPGSGTFQAYTYNAATAKLNDYNFHAYPGTFLSDLSWSVGNVPLKEITMPGTHDAAMYNLVLGPADVSETQWGDIPYQLGNGARYFDFRVGYYLYNNGDPRDANDKFAFIDTPYVVQSDAFLMYGHSAILTGYQPRDLINQVQNWLIANPSEVVFLDFTNQAFVGSARDMTSQFANELANTQHPDLIYTPYAACGTNHCTDPRVQPQNVTINQMKTKGGSYGARLVLVNTPDALTKLGWGWQGVKDSQVGYCGSGGVDLNYQEIACITNGDSGTPSIESLRPKYVAADAAPNFTQIVAALTPGFAGPLLLADGTPGIGGFNNGSDGSDLNNQLSNGAWNVNALNMVTIDGLKDDALPSLLIQRNRQTWIDMHFFNNRADNPAGALSIGANGDIWAAGAKHSLSLFKYNRATATWDAKVNGVPNIKKLAVDPLGGVWAINDYNGIDADTGTLLHYDLNGQNLNTTDSVVRDVAVGKNGSVWAMGVDLSIFEVSGPTDGSADIKASVPTQRGTHLTVDNKGDPWVIDLNGHIQKFNGSSWQQVSNSQGREIAAGVDGSIFITGYGTPSIGRYNIQNNNLDFFLMDADHIAVEPGGQPWAIRHRTGTIYKGSLDQM